MPRYYKYIFALNVLTPFSIVKLLFFLDEALIKMIYVTRVKKQHNDSASYNYFTENNLSYIIILLNQMEKSSPTMKTCLLSKAGNFRLRLRLLGKGYVANK